MVKVKTAGLRTPPNVHLQLPKRRRHQGTTGINDLPKELMVDILCRLSRSLVVQCKCVSKRWYTLISDPYFVGRFLSLNSDKKTPIKCGMIFTDYPYSFILLLRGNSESIEKSRPKVISLTKKKNSKAEYPCVVLATYNDLILCSNSWNQSADYYVICNPHTTEQVALPPINSMAPRKHNHGSLLCGFICDPYYKYYKEEDLQGTQHVATGNGTTVILNPEYRCRVVRIESSESSFELNMHIFFSETGEWREFVLVCPQRVQVYCSGFTPNAYHPGVAYNGKLYWVGEAGLMELNPLACDSNTSSVDIVEKCCRFIEIEIGKMFPYKMCRLEVCGGHLYLMAYGIGTRGTDICKLKVGHHQVDQGLAAGKWYFQGILSLFRYDVAVVLLAAYLDPFDDYRKYQGIVKKKLWCGLLLYPHIRKQLKKANDNLERTVTFPFVLPWSWPTPVPRIRKIQQPIARTS